MFEIRCSSGTFIRYGEGRSKKLAKHNAARNLILCMIESEESVRKVIDELALLDPSASQSVTANRGNPNSGTPDVPKDSSMPSPPSSDLQQLTISKNPETRIKPSEETKSNPNVLGKSSTSSASKPVQKTYPLQNAQNRLIKLRQREAMEANESSASSSLSTSSILSTSSTLSASSTLSTSSTLTASSASSFSSYLQQLRTPQNPQTNINEPNVLHKPSTPSASKPLQKPNTSQNAENRLMKLRHPFLEAIESPGTPPASPKQLETSQSPQMSIKDPKGTSEATPSPLKKLQETLLQTSSTPAKLNYPPGYLMCQQKSFKRKLQNLSKILDQCHGSKVTEEFAQSISKELEDVLKLLEVTPEMFVEGTRDEKKIVVLYLSTDPEVLECDVGVDAVDLKMGLYRKAVKALLEMV